MQVANIIIDFDETRKEYRATIKTNEKVLDGTEGVSGQGPIAALEDLIENVWAAIG